MSVAFGGLTARTYCLVIATGGPGLCLGVFGATGSATSTGIKWTWTNDGNCPGGIQQTVTFKLRK